LGSIFTFHFFHNHLRPENFPMDTVIFTGKMTLSRFRKERPAEYERLVREGRLGEILTDPPTAIGPPALVLVWADGTYDRVWQLSRRSLQRFF
jgi:hypothetical protein